MASFLKDKHAKVYKKSAGYQDAYGVWHKGGYSLIGNLWCYTRQLSQDQKNEARIYGVDESRMFVFNYRNDVAVYDLILYRGTWYTITRVDTTNDNKGDLFVYVNEAATGDISKPSELPAD